MKIGIDISQIVHEGTGVANYTKELVRHLLTIDQENDYVLFGLSLRKLSILQDFYESLLSLNNKVAAKFYPIPPSLADYLWNRFHLFPIERLVGEIDVFHSSDWIQPPAKAKKVTTVHDLVVYKYPETSNSKIISTQKRRLRWVKKECDLIFADSLATKKDLISILGFDSAKIEVVYPGVGDEFRPADEEEKLRVRQKYNLYSDYILTVGTKEPRKNLAKTAAAFNRFLHHSLVTVQNKPIKLVIVGKTGWGEEDLNEGESVQKLGLVDQKDLPALYSASSFFVYLSLYEGFGLPVIEAMACGVPVLTSDRGSLKEIAAGSALVVDPEMEDEIAVQMTKIYVDSSLRGELRKKGKENAVKYNWRETARTIRSFYQRIKC